MVQSLLSSSWMMGRHSICVVVVLAITFFPSSSLAFAMWGRPSLLVNSNAKSSSTNTQHGASVTENGEELIVDDTTTTTNGANGIDSSSSEACVKTIDILSLDSIRSTLIRQEETIIFALIERAQYRHNPIVYDKEGFGSLGTPPGASESDDEPLSFMEWMLIGTETMHYHARRYTSPEEHAFFPHRLPKTKLLQLPQLDYPTDLLSSLGGASDVNFNEILLKKYLDVIVPKITKQGDDEQHGSTCLSDIAVLQALSKRVHYGKFVAESKYRADPEGYQRLVDNNDADGVMELLTNAKVEKEVLRRARLKAATYGREPLLASFPSEGKGKETTSIVAAAAAAAVVAAIDAMDADEQSIMDGNKVDPEVIEFVYRDIIIPLTKDIEVAYLFKRCGKEPPSEYQPDRMSIDVKRQREAEAEREP